jgi:hypothetical protein
MRALRRTHSKRVLVGHNLFTDLAFIHKTFVGHLPLDVSAFQEMIHELFPIVIDTKYPSTYNADAMNPRANLKETLAPFLKVHVPSIVLHKSHTEYGSAYGKEHEAGYDSWMTAELFIKLSAKLYSNYDEASFTSATTTVDSFYSYYSCTDSDSSSGGVRLNDSHPSSATPRKTNAAPATGSPSKQVDDNSFITPTKPGRRSMAMPIVNPETTRPAFDPMFAIIMTPPPVHLLDMAISPESFKRLTPLLTNLMNVSATSSSMTTTPSSPHPIDMVISPDSEKTVTPQQSHLMSMSISATRDYLPPSYPAGMLNPSAKEIFDTDEEAAAAAAEPVVEQWLPSMKSAFWRPYVN